jgi:radical SAM/Cys-rich protein
MGKFDFGTVLEINNLEFKPISIQTLWLNITRRCNQSCIHCHVGASPQRTEQMSRATIERCLEVISGLESCDRLDITGGAPELHPDFQYLVMTARKLDKKVVVRHNLTITLDGDPSSGEARGYIPDFYAENNVEILASLPHYTEQVTDMIRGPGVFRKSIMALRRLNELGYSRPGSGLVLNVVFNCDGPVSTAERASLEIEFKKELFEKHGVIFNGLLAVTNMPVGRFRSRLSEQGTLEEYITKLADSFDQSAVGSLVCRNLISVGYDGRLYDCDFNQMLGMEIENTSIFSFDISRLLDRRIRVGPHCFGCTAGGGSS